MRDGEPVFWPAAALVAAFRRRELSPIEVTQQVLDRIDRFDDRLNAYLSVTPDAALEQAARAEALYLTGDAPESPVLGVPTSIKDLFDMHGAATTLGSRLFGDEPMSRDSEPVRRLREAGAVLLGKSNTSEFGQSATTENLLRPACANPWDPTRTAGGSSGGAAASVGAGLATLALGSDGGGSIRLPAAMCGMVGVKPTFAPASPDEPFRAMSDFVCPGPIVRCVADARAMLSVNAGQRYVRRATGRLRVGWAPTIGGAPVDPGVAKAVAGVIDRLEEMGHEVTHVELPVDGWLDAFGPLVLADEWQHRRALVADHADELTDYARKGIEAAAALTLGEVETARVRKLEFERSMAAIFAAHDIVVTPTAACVAFAIGERPAQINGQQVSSLWGPFPFTAPFNVTGSPAASLPCGFVDGMPVGVQIVGPHHGESGILDLCEDLEEAIAFPTSELLKRWSLRASAA